LAVLFENRAIAPPKGQAQLSVNPTSGSVTGGVSTLGITATLLGSTAALSATVSGGGTISTAAPASGVPFTYTPPVTGTGSATVTVKDTIDNLTAQCYPIYYQPASIGQSLGMNLGGAANYYNPEQPFINVMNMAGSNNPYVNWFTGVNGGTFDSSTKSSAT
jgi:hypothetical protein